MLLNDNKEILSEVKSKLKDISYILNKQDCDMVCLVGSCPFKINLSGRCLIGVLEEVCYDISNKLDDF